MDKLNATATEHRTGFEEQIAPHLQALSAIAWRFTHDTATAQDLVQETLLKAYRFFHRFEMGTNFWAWLLTIMRNLHITQVRKQAREEILVDVEHLPSMPEHAVMEKPDLLSPDDLSTVLPYLITDDVMQALDLLPEEYRTAVLLADLLEYSYKDIATLMDCPLGTVMSRLHRGRQMLQSQLQPYAVAQGYIHDAAPGRQDETGVRCQTPS